MAKTTLHVPDISCEHCERTVKETLGPIAGVQAVAVDIPAKRVTVDYDAAKVTVDRMKEALKEEDYPVAAVE